MMISSIGSISSSSSATVRVDKATSEFLMAPDWTMNIDICDTINTNRILAKDVVKAVKKRLQHKNPKVQLLALTLLETMVKNCGDYVHFQIADKHILQDMVKIVKKRTDMHVRDKVLALIGSWYEAFGASQGKYPQYIMAYEDLRRSGVQFPERSADAAAIFTPSVTQSVAKQPQPGYGMPSSSSTRLDAAMAADVNFSLSNINSMRDVLFLLADMLQAIDSTDRMAVKDEVIVELVEQCRSNQKKLMDVLSTCGDEELLGQGLELNDDMQSILARHDAIASGSPLPLPSHQLTNTKASGSGSEKLESSSSPRPADVDAASAASNANASISVVPSMSLIDEEEEEEDDFAQLARRHSKPRADASNQNDIASSSEAPATSNALVPVTMPAPAAQSKEQDIIDLLSLTLTTSTTTTEQQSPVQPGMHGQPQVQASSANPGPYSTEATPGNPGLAFNSYVAPWAQPQPQPQPQPQFQSHTAHTPYMHPEPQRVNTSQINYYPQNQSYAQYQPVYQPQLSQSQSPYVNQQPSQQQYSAYPPPPWAATPGYYTNSVSTRPLQNTYAAPRPTYESSINGETYVNNSPRSAAAPAPSGGGQKAFIPSYRLFEDLDVFGNADGRFKAATGNASHSLSGSANQGMVGGRK